MQDRKKKNIQLLYYVAFRAWGLKSRRCTRVQQAEPPILFSNLTAIANVGSPKLQGPQHDLTKSRALAEVRGEGVPGPIKRCTRMEGGGVVKMTVPVWVSTYIRSVTY